MVNSLDVTISPIDQTLANKAQCNLLRKMIDNHSNRVLSSYMKGDTMIVETENGEKHFIGVNGKKIGNKSQKE